MEPSQNQNGVEMHFPVIKYKNDIFELPISFKPKYDHVVKLRKTIKDLKLLSFSGYYKLPNDIKDYLKTLFTQSELKAAIAEYAHEVNEKAFTFIDTKGARGWPFRYLALANFLRDDGMDGQLHDEFKAYPLKNLREGVTILNHIKWREMLPPTFYTDIEKIMNQVDNKRNVLYMQGTSNSGKSILVNMLTSHVATGYISHTEDLSNAPYLFENLVDKRLAHIQGAADEAYLSWFGKHDRAIAFTEDHGQVNIHERGHKPVCIFTPYDSLYRQVYGGAADAMRTRCHSYEFDLPLDPEMITLDNLTPFHYITMLSLEQRDPIIFKRPQELDEALAHFVKLWLGLLSNGLCESTPALDCLFEINKNIDFPTRPIKDALRPIINCS
ncbi:hypothetical protein CcNV_016 [Crangon crangon nudivirus]|uniref:Parvovirus non-structural protein 1 helicase domain-containing protein n=1 Tax=Crangon crangon nudivirus TaxID=2880838 RepID=A0AAE9BZU0_9VIRU|nr:hypothetical protein QKT25_gp016 [Crangon crangon nudivirus]UBZ25500.1 hypothetical protein CcNV_016 [Crangon crangon nudivirus]